MKIIINKKNFLFLFILINFKTAFANENFNQLRVEADISIEYFEKEKIYVASGNAKASKRNFSINAQKITAFVDKAKDTGITNLEAIGDVIIFNKNTIAKSDTAKYNFKKKIIILTGNNQSIETKKFKLLSKKFIAFNDIKKIADSEGDVKLFLNNSLSIFSQKIKANFDKENNHLISASALGNVKIKTKLETITSDSAKYDKKTDIISLKGNVTIKRDKNVLTGEKGYMNLNTRKSKIESSKSKRVKGIFSPIRK